MWPKRAFVLPRWPQCDCIPAVENGAHEHASGGRGPGIHSVLVLVPAGSLPGPGLHADVSDRLERPAEDAQAGDQVEC